MSSDKPVANQLMLNKKIAYAGDIGRKRREFCIDFIKKKQESSGRYRKARRQR
jgi:hypothetical protein